MAERSPFPTAEELHEAQMEELKLSLHFAGVGRIQSYDPVHQVADVVPQVRHPWPQPDGTYVFEDLPVLPSVPVVFPRMGKWFLAFSVEAGDAVQLIYDSAAPGAWRRQADSGATGLDRVRELKNPATLQRHHLSNAVAIPGIDTYARALRHAPDVATGNLSCLTLGRDGDGDTRLSIYGSGIVKITRGADVVLQIDADGTVHIGGAAGDFLALAGLVKTRLDTIQAAFDTHTHPVVGAVPATPGTPPTVTAPIPLIGPLASVAATKAKGV